MPSIFKSIPSFIDHLTGRCVSGTVRPSGLRAQWTRFPTRNPDTIPGTAPADGAAGRAFLTGPSFRPPNRNP
jgi:hypothetical protein